MTETSEIYATSCHNFHLICLWVVPLADNLATCVYFYWNYSCFHIYLISSSNYIEAIEETTEASEHSTLSFKGSTIYYLLYYHVSLLKKDIILLT